METTFETDGDEARDGRPRFTKGMETVHETNGDSHAPE